MLARGTLYQVVLVAADMPLLSALSVQCPATDHELREPELRALFRCPGLLDIRPIDGFEANLTILAGTCDQPIPAPIFRGRYDEACERAWALPPGHRASALVVTHGEVLSWPELEARRPRTVATPASLPPRRGLFPWRRAQAL